MENVMYNCTLTYGICESFGSLYSFQMNLYIRSYFLVLQVKDLINKDGDTAKLFKLVTGTKPSV